MMKKTLIAVAVLSLAGLVMAAGNDDKTNGKGNGNGANSGGPANTVPGVGNGAGGPGNGAGPERYRIGRILR